MNCEAPEAEARLDWLAPLLQTNDSLFPSGSYAHSFGLEGLTQLGLVTDRDTLAEFLREQVLPALRRLELPLVRFAHAAALEGSVTRLLALDELYGAMKGTWELRQASRRIGAQRLAMLRTLAQHPLLEDLEVARSRGRFQTHAPIVFGVQTALADTPPAAALTAYFYQTLAALLSAALKLLRLGQVGAQSLLTECLAEAGAAVAEASTVPEPDAGWFNPLLEIASARHETAYTRIFIS